MILNFSRHTCLNDFRCFAFNRTDILELEGDVNNGPHADVDNGQFVLKPSLN